MSNVKCRHEPLLTTHIPILKKLKLTGFVNKKSNLYVNISNHFDTKIIEFIQKQYWYNTGTSKQLIGCI